MFSFVVNCQTVFRSGYTVLHSHQQWWEFLLLHILACIWCCQCLNFGHSIRYVVVSHCFNLHFPDDMWCGASFHMCLFTICLSSLLRCLFSSFAHFLKKKYLFILLCLVLVAAPGIFVVACGIFSCGMWDQVLWQGIEPGPPALGVWSLSHWTTREVPAHF